ncbi:tRNA(Met) cytidine acetyltransferase TmcA [Neptunomonas antarctica]|uniref:tRNA(Met) cytidine acetyltransferase TmcA n=1 Tax=Neptunomonas antarctica TaxID=619304 RepID=A0A1N7M6Z1_9GAMM|nr:GNAT family N-acetyltransferase [Neptunomonas antarctica]SIS81857.1 tRNA(Met)-cytidine N(4)-acetyltransferase [Neptunomonas antarctica]
MSALVSDDFGMLVDRLRQLAQQENIRFPCWLTGSAEWTAAKVQQYIEADNTLTYSIISSRMWPGLLTCSTHQAHRLLGQEMSMIVYDGFSGINPDALGQISGLIKGGGLFVLLTPPPESSAFYNDPEKQRLRVEPYEATDVGNNFLNHLKYRFAEDQVLVRFDQQQGLMSVLPELASAAGSERESYSHSHSVIAPESVERRSIDMALADQNTLTNNIIRQFKIPGAQCCVLTAARGRGKSAALGIIARQLLSEGENVVVTAPRSDALESLFRHAAGEPGFQRSRYQVVGPQSMLTFHLPVDVCRANVDADILLVDEAAGIPVNLLSKYLHYYSRIIFATTTQGYEGTGQGFTLRFVSELKKQGSALHCYTLEKPIRWSDQDPLEAFFNRVLLLDAASDQPDREAVESLDEKTFSVGLPCVEYRLVSPEWLVAHPDKLRALFGLMIEAHYRTTPGDLRIMLDSPNLKIWIAELAGCIVGACLVAQEGGLDDELVKHIWEGRRRPRGHLIPQLLIAQEGYIEAASLTALRIVRIAVSDQHRRQGIALGLLQAIEKWSESQTIDLMGASFAVTPALLDFWQTAGYQVIRIGSQLDPVSGSYAVLVLKGLSVIAKYELCLWQAEFQKRLIYLQGEWLKDLDSEVLQRVQLHVPEHQARSEIDDWRDLAGFAFHFRAYESSACIFSRLAITYRSLWDQPSADFHIKYLIEARVIQQKNESEVLDKCHLPGSKALVHSLRLAAAYFYEQAQRADVLI